MRAFHETLPRIPVWLMRQAGRYLPEYQALRRRYSLSDLFDDPSLALDISLQPLRRFDLDAAIVFMDILTPFKGLQAEVLFPDGHPPKVIFPYRGRPGRDWPELDLDKIKGSLTVIEQLRAILPPQKAVIGFIGGPWTILRYVLGMHTDDQDPPSDSNIFEAWLIWLTRQLKTFLKAQIQAGADCIQIFDTWALTAPVSLLQDRYLALLCDLISVSDVPVIYFTRNTRLLFPIIQKLPCQGFSVDSEFEWDQAMDHLNRLWQGNLDPQWLLPEKDGLEQAVERLLKQTQRLPHYVFNLGHGVPVRASIERIETVLSIVRTFETQRSKRDSL